MFAADGSSKVARTQEELEALMAAGYKDTPEAHKPDYKTPPPVEEDLSLPEEARDRGYVPQQFPAFVFHASEAPRKLADAAELAALGPGWHDTPEKATNAAVEQPQPTAPPPPPPPAAQPAPVATDNLTPEDREKLSQYAARVPDVITIIAGIKDAAVLEKVERYENANPKGARKMVIEAIDTRRQRMAAEAEEEAKKANAAQ
jgi:hypothetical protein